MVIIYSSYIGANLNMTKLIDCSEMHDCVRKHLESKEPIVGFSVYSDLNCHCTQYSIIVVVMILWSDHFVQSV